MSKKANALKIFVLGHQELQLSKIADHELIEKTNLCYLDLPIENNNHIAENRFFLVDQKKFNDCPDYIGVLSANYDNKYPHLISLGSMERLVPKLKENIVFAASPTETFCEGKWVDYSYKYHVTFEKYLEDMAKTFSLKLDNQPTFWANNFICHKKVFLDFLVFFKTVFKYMHEKYAYTYQMKVDDTSRVSAYVYERVSMLYFANRSDLEIRRITCKDGFAMSQINFISTAGDNYDILSKNCISSLQASGVRIEDIQHNRIELPKDISHQIRFGSDAWHLAIKNKIQYMVDYLQEKQFCDKYKYFICHDCDVQFFPGREQHWEEMFSLIDSTDYDFYFQPEIVKGVHELCAGFYVVKKNRLQKAINFLKIVLNHLQTTPQEELEFADQTVIKNLQKKTKFMLLPDKYCQFAGLLNLEHRDTYLFHHAINARNIQEKLKQMRMVRDWMKIKKSSLEIK